MCPSFSLCACRILKIRSCLRRPLVPGISRPRASFPSSWIFFSFNSEIVIVTCQELVDIGGDAAERIVPKGILRKLSVRRINRCSCRVAESCVKRKERRRRSRRAVKLRGVPAQQSSQTACRPLYPGSSVPTRESGQEPHSSCLADGCWAYATYE